MPRHHKTLQRLYVHTALSPDQPVALDRNQSNYLVNVLRKQPGDELIVFNGADGAWLAALETPSKKAATLTLLERVAEQPEAPDLWYGFAPLKAGRLDYMIQKATEMGATKIQPVMTQFTQVKNLKHDRLQANAIEAAEQCEVLTVPDILPEIRLSSLMETWEAAHNDRVMIFADEEAASASPLAALEKVRGERLGLIIGPEGGFSEEERALLSQKDFTLPISLGPRILRADTAAVAALAVIQASIGDWR